MRRKLIKHKYNILLVLFATSFIASLILSSGDTSGLCGIDSGCDIVQNSSYASFLGIKNSVYGVIIFSFLFLLSIIESYKPGRKKRLFIDCAVVMGASIAIYFIYLQAFVIKYYCKYCMVADISLLLALLLIILTWKK